MSSSAPDDHDPKLEGLDYTEAHDIRDMHAAVVREKAEPEDGMEPISIWMIVFFMAVIGGGGWYLGQFSGGFRADVFEHLPVGWGGPSGSGAAGGAEVAKKELSLVEIGEKAYKQNCLACHGAGGLGAAGLYPPLVGSDWVTGSTKRVTAILLNGLEGPITVNGAVYNGAMPAWAKNLNDEKMAGVLTYIRQSWGNTASEITPDQVAWARDHFASRTKAWSEAELLAITEELPPPAAPAAAEAAPAEAAAP